jgi:hypothetical protein
MDLKKPMFDRGRVILPTNGKRRLVAIFPPKK